MHALGYHAPRSAAPSADAGSPARHRTAPLSVRPYAALKTGPGPRGLGFVHDRCRIGADVTLSTLAAHRDVRAIFPALAEAAACISTPETRSLATVGGQLLQHSRCGYYRRGDPGCRKNGGATCLAREGDSRAHAIFSGHACISPCVSQLATALCALEARMIVQRSRRAEALTTAQLYAAAWASPAVHHSLAADDRLLHVEVPLAPGRRSTYLQVAAEGEHGLPLVSCAAAADVAEGRLHRVRIALGAVAPLPWSVAAAHAFLEGRAVTTDVAERAADLILREARPLADNAYKLTIAKALIRRALARLAS